MIKISEARWPHRLDSKRGLGNKDSKLKTIRDALLNAKRMCAGVPHGGVRKCRGCSEYDRLRRAACLIADMQMPQMSGLELHHRLSALGVFIPAILITEYPEDSVRTRALVAGITSCAAKRIGFDKWGRRHPHGH
jgi:CheY-like chemotaxis protein